jgi:hypothetical protein
MPYTSNLRLSVQSAGSNSGTWGAGGVAGDDLNTGVMGILDTKLAGFVTFSVSSSAVSLSHANVQNNMFRFTGTLLANIVVSPAVGDATTYFNGFYLFENATTGSFTITLQNATGSVVLPQGRRGIVFVSAASTVAPRIVSITGTGTADPIPTGSTTIWYNASAPAGWTAVSSVNDYLMKVVDNGGGGVSSGTVPYSTLFSRTQVDAHTLTEAELPAHRHFTVNNDSVPLGGGTSNPVSASTSLVRNRDNQYLLAGTATSPSAGLSALTGSGDSHVHTMDMRVRTLAFVLASRD